MKNACIMIVEDESIVAKDIQASLKNLGYTVVAVAASGEEALAKVGDAKPDLVLMDVMLKGKMDGIEAAGYIRERYKIPVVYLTAYTDDETLRRAKISEAFGYLLKPFEDRELRTTIEIALYKHTMERQLTESREWLATTLRCIGDAVIATDANRSIRFINPPAERLTDWSRREALGRQLTDVLCLVHGSTVLSVDQEVDKLMNGQAADDFGPDVCLVSRDGNQFDIEYSATAIRDDAGRALGVVVTFRDITDRKSASDRERELQDRLARSQRIESLGMLAGGVAHDLNNILGPIVGYPDLIIKNLPPNSPVRQDLEIIKNSARKAVDVIRDLLTLGRIGHFPADPLRFNAVVESVLKSQPYLNLCSNAPLVDVEVQLAPDVSPILGSESHLKELVKNLIVNGIHAMPEGGHLIVRTEPLHLETPIEGYEIITPGEYVVFSVEDSGRGVLEEDINRMFEPFYGKPKIGSQNGSGLGLAVVYGVVKEHKGFIDVISTTGKGAVFQVYLPVSGQAGEALPKVERVDYRGTETILVVDDDEEQRKFAARGLRSIGYKVLTAHSGASALEIVESVSKTSESGMDLVVLDMIMADEMDGLDTFKQMLTHNPRQKAIIVSGFAVTERIRDSLKLGVGKYIQKPYTIEELGRAVRSELDKPARSLVKDEA